MSCSWSESAIVQCDGFIREMGSADSPFFPILQKVYSTEELTEEMANLEGLMKNLTAITQKDFECTSEL